MEVQIRYLVFFPRVTILTSENEDLSRLNTQIGIFQGDTRSLSLLVIDLIPLSQTLRKVNAGY